MTVLTFLGPLTIRSVEDVVSCEGFLNGRERDSLDDLEREIFGRESELLWPENLERVRARKESRPARPTSGQ